MTAAPVHQWLARPMPKDVTRAIDRLARTPDVTHVAIMPDVHLAHDVCVGTVVATANTLLPQAVGGDIGCGMAVLAFDASADVLRDEPAAMRLLGALPLAVPANRQPGPRDARSLPAHLTADRLSDPSLDAIVRREGIVQLGTLGRGNHFLEFQVDDEDRLWLMVHTGSRAVGQAIRDLHLSRAELTTTGLGPVRADTDAGQAYLHDAEWARRYAAANRRAIADAAAARLNDLFDVRAMESSYVDCDHNHVGAESHFGQTWFVHRKGAAPAGDGVAGIIPGSMGTPSFHTLGRGCAASLCSSSHGAGRALSRSDARRQLSLKRLHRDMQGVWFAPSKAESVIEESPAAYNDIRAVMRAQRQLTRIVRQVRPILNYKGP